MHKVLLTKRAEQSLEEIIDYYLENETTGRANKVLASIEDALTSISKHPNTYPVCFDVKQPSQNIRQIIVHHTFKIVFRVSPKVIEVLEIFHGNRNSILLKDVE
jgi:plasmid stabilization system protein ParE